MKFTKLDRTVTLTTCTLLFCFFCANVIAQSSNSIPLFVVNDHGKLGIIDSAGNKKFEGSIDEIIVGNRVRKTEAGLLYYSSMGVAKVRTKGKWGLIFANNGILTPVIYDKVVAESDRRRKTYIDVSLNGKWGCYSMLGNLIAPAEYDTVIQGPSSEYFKVKKGNLYGLFTQEGRKVADPLYEDFAYLSPAFIAVKLNGKWGVIDTMGELKIPAKFERLDMFSSGHFKFIEGGKWGVVDQLGNIIEPARFDYKDSNPRFNNSFSFKSHQDGERLFVVQIDGKFGLIDNTGKVIVEPASQQVVPFYKSMWWGEEKDLFGLYDSTQLLLAPQFDYIGAQWQDKDFNHFAIVMRSGKSGLVNGKGKLIIEPQFDELSFQETGILIFRIDQKYGLCDTLGREILKAQYDKIEYQYSNNYRIEKDGRIGMADLPGNVVVYPEHQDVRKIRDNRYTFVKNDKIGVLDGQGNILIEAIYDGIYSNGENLLVVNADWSVKDVLNFEGKPVITQVHDETDFFGILNRKDYTPLLRQKTYNGCGPGPVMPYMMGNMLLKRKGKWGVTDNKGNILIKPKCDSILSYFFENLSAYKRKGMWGLINKQGNVISKPIFQEIIMGDMMGCSRVRKNNKWGYLDNAGHLIIEPVYDKADHFNYGLAHVMLNGKSLLINQTGKVIWAEN